MKKVMLVGFFIFLTVVLYAQENKVKSNHNVKATFLGLSYAFEQPVAQRTVVNFELMFAGGLGSSFFVGDYWLIAPIMRVEPRYYYNYMRREGKGKKVINNSASYISFVVDYQLGVSIGSNNVEAARALCLIPEWGLKRTIGKHFVFEFATGIGAYTSEVDEWQPTFGLDLKLGYSF